MWHWINANESSLIAKFDLSTHKYQTGILLFIKYFLKSIYQRLMFVWDLPPDTVQTFLKKF